MALICQFTGNKSKDNQHAEDALLLRYESALGTHNVNLHRVTGSGYKVMSATRIRPAGGAYRPGDRFKSNVSEDIGAEVKQVLRSAGIAILE